MKSFFLSESEKYHISLDRPSLCYYILYLINNSTTTSCMG